MVSGTFSIVGDPEGHIQRLSAPFRFPFYDKDHLTHGHFSKGKEQTLRRDGIPDAVQCPVRELSLTRETTDERRTREKDCHALRNVLLQDSTPI